MCRKNPSAPPFHPLVEIRFPAMDTPVENEQIISVGIGAIVFTTMIIIGLDVTVQDFKQLFKRPKPILIGLIAPALLVPLVIGAVQLWELPSHLEAGLMLVVICPAGNFSNVYIAVARANTALSIILCVTSILLSFATIPLGMELYEYFLKESFDFSVPASLLLVRLFLGLALPVGLGMWIRSRFPAFERKCHWFLRKLLSLAVISLGMFIIFSDRKEFASDFRFTAIAAVILTVVSMTIGFVLSRITKLDHRDTYAIVLASPVRNMAIVIALAVSVFHQSEFATFAVTLFMIQIPILLTTSLLFRRFSALPAKK